MFDHLKKFDNVRMDSHGTVSRDSVGDVIGKIDQNKFTLFWVYSDFGKYVLNAETLLVITYWLNKLNGTQTGITQRVQRDVAIQHLAAWAVAIQTNGASWDDWDEYYKDVICRDNALPEIRELLNAAIQKEREKKGE